LVERFGEEKAVSVGYFVKAKDNLLVMNKNIAVEVTINCIKWLDSYKSSEYFESVEYIIELDILMVAKGVRGVALHWYISNPKLNSIGCPTS
jgi:hypothetical protein